MFVVTRPARVLVVRGRDLVGDGMGVMVPPGSPLGVATQT